LRLDPGDDCINVDHDGDAPMNANAHASHHDILLTANDAAKLLRMSLSWLAKARLRGDGPRFVKVGRSVRYPEVYVREYIKIRTRSSTSEMLGEIA
jgi:predicted DNA-binding transcriptional regulator AlpA